MTKEKRQTLALDVFNIINDVNHETWTKTKKRVIESLDNDVVLNQDVTITYKDVVDDVNFAVYKETQQRVIDDPEDTASIDYEGSATIAYKDVVDDVNFAVYKTEKARVIELFDDNAEQVSNVTVDYEKILNDANFASYKLTKERITENYTDSKPADCSVTAVYDDVLKDVNHAAYKHNKRKVVNDVIANTSFDSVVTFSDIQDRVNYESYKLTGKRIVENTDTDTVTKATVSLKHEDVKNAANLIAFRDGKKWIVSDKNESTSDIAINIDNIKDGVNFEAYKVDKKHVVEGNIQSITNKSVSVDVDAIRSEVNTVSWRTIGRNITDDTDTSYSFTISHDKIKAKVDAVSWKVAQCRLDDAEKRFESQTDDSTYDTGFVAYAVAKALNNIASKLPSASVDGNTISMQENAGWKGNAIVMGEYIDKYIVDYSISEWFKVVMPSEANIYISSSEDSLKRLVEEITNNSWLDSQIETRIAELQDLFGIRLTSYTASTHSFSLSFTDKWMGNIDVIKGYMFRYVAESILNDWFRMASPNITTYANSSAQFAQLITDEINSDESGMTWFAFMSNKALSEIKSVMSLYATYNENTFTLKMHDGWRGSSAAIEAYINQYFVDYILHRWFLSTKPELAGHYISQANQLLDKIADELERNEDASEWFADKINSVIAIIKDELRPILKIDDVTTNDNITNFILTLSYPWKGNVDSLNEYIKQYAVNYVLEQWFIIIDAAKASKYTEEALSWKEKWTAEAFSEDTNSDFLKKVRTSALQQLKDDLTDVLSSTTDSTTEYKYTFNLGNNWMGSISSISDYINNYVVDYILYRWMLLVSVENAEKYAGSSDVWHQRILAEAKSEENSSQWFGKMFGNAIDRLKDDLRFCTKLYGDKQTGNDYKFDFQFSSTWRGSVDSLKSYVHGYIVDYILREWYVLTEPESAPHYAETTAQWSERLIREAKSEDENTDWVKGIYNAAIEQLKGQLRFCIYLSEETEGSEEGETEGSEDNYTFRFRLSDTWRGSMSSLSNYIHHYIVDYILYEWFGLISPDHMAKYSDNVSAWNEKIIAEAKSEDQNIKWFNHMWSTAINQVKDDLRFCIKLDDKDVSSSDYTFNFRFKDGWKGSISVMKDYIRRYVVDYILSEWAKVNGVDKSQYSDTSVVWRDKIIAEAKSEDKNLKWFNRMWATAITQIKDELRFCIELNDTDVSSGDYTFQFRFQDGWRGSISAIGNYIHRYVVDYILNEWAKRTQSDALKISMADVENWSAKIISEAHSEEDNTLWFYGQLDAAMSNIVSKLKWCASKSGNAIDFTLSPTWKGNFDSLSKYIHRYIVNFILYEWFRMSQPSEAEAYLTSADSLESEVINEARSEDVSNVYFRL